MLTKNQRAEIIILGVTGFLLLVIPAHLQADSEGDIKSLMKDYLMTAQKIYAPPSAPKTREDIQAVERLRQKAAEFWVKGSVRASMITKDFAFLRSNAPFPWSIKSMEIAEDFARLIIQFELDPAGKNKFVSREGQYSLVFIEGDWKLLKFETPKKEDVLPLPKDAPPEELLTAYFNEMQIFFKTTDDQETAPQLSLVSIRTKTARFWKLAERDITLPSMKSAMFFNTYRPNAWKIQEIRTSGDFSRITTRMTVGSPLQIRLHKGPFDRLVRYSLIREDGRWFITGFEEVEEKE